MDYHKLDKITGDLISNYFRNEEVIYSGVHHDTVEEMEELVDDLLEVIASLHNELYKEVTGDYYNYMFHWVNKITGGIWECLDNRYKEGKKK